MGKPYDHQYFFAGSGCRHGTMICAKCGQAIDGEGQDWMSYKKPANFDWGLVCFHRSCAADQSRWLKLEADARAQADRHDKLMADLNALMAKHKVSADYIVLILEDER
jgi:hypothetical protein